MRRLSIVLVLVLVLVLAAAGTLLGQQRATMADLGPNLPAQPVGIRDLLAVSVYGAPELTRTVRVSEEGTIRLPLIKQRIPVTGLMPVTIEDRIVGALASEQILVDPVVTVNIAEFASRPISVVGAVKRPLTFQASGQTTLLDALAKAEGLAPEAGGEILVTRLAGDGTPLTRRVSVQALLELADPDANLALQGGEEVRVPEVGRVFVVGNVVAPGAFPVSPDQNMTVMKALALSSGLSPFATKEAFIYRPVDSGEKQEIQVELRKIMDRKQDDVELMAGDIFYVPDNRGRRLAANIIDRIVAFGTGTASGALIYSFRSH